MPLRQFTIDPDAATKALVPLHERTLEDVLLVGLPSLEEKRRPVRFHTRSFPAPLARCFSLLAKTPELRRVAVRQRLVSWYGLARMRNRPEIVEALQRQARVDMEGDIMETAYHARPEPMELVDSRFRVATNETQFCLNQDVYEDLETLAVDLFLQRTLLLDILIMAAFSGSTEWVPATVRKACIGEVERFMRRLTQRARSTERQALGDFDGEREFGKLEEEFGWEPGVGEQGKG